MNVLIIYRYAGYYWDRKTQYYYLQARYYDPRLARFISDDTYEGQIDTPLSLNQYGRTRFTPLREKTGYPMSADLNMYQRVILMYLLLIRDLFFLLHRMN